MFDKRAVTLDEAYKRVSGNEFETLLSALKQGDIESTAYCIDLLEGLECVRNDNRKHPLTTEEWASSTLKLDGAKGIHLVDSQNCQAHAEITLKSTDANRLLKLTMQSGGEQPKMGPKVYAFLAARFAYGDFEASIDPEDLFTELEGRSDLWDHRGPISQNRGVAAIREFLSVLSQIDQQLRDDISVSDISFASKD
ncbi:MULTISPECIES: hypothetical protein [unclassified Sulfitobacter]|uniref:hypothetical protein n=1 Tax=unclassified Sulfitobacter TaxID=196795 RepID=UPI0037471659